MTTNETSQATVIAVAITGSVPMKVDNPAVPITPTEQIESTHEAYEAGATLVHIHVRNDDGSSSSDCGRFAEVLAGIRLHCPSMILQFSTGGRGRDPSERASSLSLRPDMASLATGSVNFPTIIYQNHPTLVDEMARQMQACGVRPEIELFDLSHLHAARRLADEGLIDERPHIQMVMGIKNSLPASERLLDLMIAEMRALFPKATWTAAGIGANQQRVMEWALARDADAVRTGLEDNIRITRDRLASSNAELVEVAKQTMHRFGRRPATTDEARARLGLVQKTPSARPQDAFMTEPAE